MTVVIIARIFLPERDRGQRSRYPLVAYNSLPHTSKLAYTPEFLEYNTYTLVPAMSALRQREDQGLMVSFAISMLALDL
jgi:hypothetical protein